MNLRPKTKRRLLILLTAALAITGLASTAVVILLRRHETHRLAYRAAAVEAYKHGDYRTAADNFAKYLGNDRMDGPAIFDYAVCRSKLPRADLSNLTQAKDLFNRYLELNPGDADAEHQLLEIYQKLQYTGESIDLSDQLLKKNPDDVPALSARLRQMVRDRHYDLALPVSMHLNELTPDDVQTQGTTYELMWHLHKPAGELIDRADRMLQTYPDDPRFELLRAVAAFCIGDREDTTKWLRTAAARTAPDAEFTLMLAGAFDRMKLWTDSRTLLEQNATAPTASVTLKANLVQRLWEIGQYDRALAVLKGLNPTDPASDSNLIGLQALVLYGKNQSDPAHLPADFKTALTSLQARPDDLTAAAWAALLSAITIDAPADPLDPVHLCQSARRSDPQNPDACFYLGREYLRIGETELALQSLKQTSQMQPEWAAPYVLTARTLLQRGQITSATQAADAAFERDPQYTGARLIFALAHYKKLTPGSNAADIRPVLNFIHQLHIIVPDDAQLLAAEVDLLARSNQKTDAVNLVASSRLTPAALYQLVLIDRSDHLGIDNLLSDRLADCQPTTPEQALNLIEADIITANETAAKALLLTIAAHPTPGWQLAWLQAREALGHGADASLISAWEQLADSLPRDLNVQSAAIHSPAVNANRPLMDRTIDRLKALTGDDAIEWKLAHARWQLSGSDDPKTTANAAAASMAEVVRIAPEYADPQELWADALVKLGDLNGAIAHLRLATQIEPDSAALSLKLARLYEQQGQIRELSLLLTSTQNSDWLTNPQRVEIAMLYRAIGDRASAIKLLDENGTIHPDDPTRDILLAQLHAELGEDADAQKTYNQWLQQKNPPVHVVRAIAWFFASHQSMTQARKALGIPLSLPPGENDLLFAEFESDWGDQSAAAFSYQNATRVAPTNPHTWLAWAGTNLRHRDFTGAFNVVNEGLKHLPSDPNLSAMKDRAQALAGMQPDNDDQDLLNALSVDPANESAAATLNALTTAETITDASEHLKAVAKNYPRFLPVQTMLIVRDFKAGLYDQAIDRATRTSELLPIEPEPARLLTIIYSAAGQWEHALADAQEWRSRSLDHPHAADVAIASAQIALHQPQRAADQVSWCLHEAVPSDINAPENPPAMAKALELYARALYMENQTNQAWRLLQPYANQSSAWRHRWLKIIADTSPDSASAAQHIHQLDPLITASSIDDRLALGEAWYTLATRFNDQTALDKAKSIIEPLTDIASAPADAWLLLGDIQQQQNNLLAAEHSFASAVNLAPNLPTAKNNLAMIMLLRKEDPKTAQQLASAAADLAPANSAIHSTLGEIDEQMNDLPSAKTQFQLAVRLNAENAEALIGLASVQSRAGETSNVTFTLQQAETVLQLTHPILPIPVREELQKLREIAKRPATSAAAKPN